MRSLHLLCAGLLTAVLIGCQDQKKQASSPQEPSGESPLAQQPQSPPEPAAEAAPAVPDDLELLVRKTEAHARRVTEEMQRTGRLAENAAKPPPPSVVEWMDDSVLKLGIVGRATEASPAAAPMAGGAGAQLAAASPAPAPATEAGTANKPVTIEEDPSTRAPAAMAMLTAPVPVLPAPAPPQPSLEQQLEKLAREYPRDVAAQLDYQLSLFIQGKAAPDLAAMASLAEEDQEIISAVLDGLTNFRNGVKADSNLLLSRKVKPLIDAGERLRARADLEVPVVELCRRVDGYGVYEPIEHRFVAGQERDVIVYCEVENFMSQFNDQSMWETRLSEEVVLYTDNDGLPVLRDKATIVPDLCRNRRSDFFIVRKLRLPGNIPVGRYWLKVTVVDQLASRVAEHSIPITFVAR